MNNQRKNRSKICYLAPDVAVPSPRGSSVHVLELGENLVSLGHEVHAITRRIRSSDLPHEEIGGVRFHRVYRWILRPEKKSSFTAVPSEIPKSKFLRRLYYAYLLTVFRAYVCLVSVWMIRKYKLDLIVERETSFGAGAFAALLTGKPITLEIIGPRYSKYAVSKSRTIFYYTESMLREWVDRRKCVSVPAGVNLSLFRPEPSLGVSRRKMMGFQPNDLVLGYVGTFQSWHGIETLLAAIKSLEDKLPNIKSLLVGPGYERYEKMTKDMGIDRLCKFTGPEDYEHVPSYINACDIMVALYDPSKDPMRKKYGIGWPIKILEYMACGKPVISTTVEPINQIITNGSLGSLVPPGSAGELAQVIENLSANPVKLGEMGERGEELVKSNYSWLAVAQKMSSFF